MAGLHEDRVGPRARPNTQSTSCAGSSARGGPAASVIDRYVFPDSELVPIHVMLNAAESRGFELREVECLREHCALTLSCWLRGLEARHDAARLLVDEATYRVWRLYMAGLARAFDTGPSTCTSASWSRARSV